VHYYLANALVKCGDHGQAAEEYRIAYMLDPAGRVSNYCAVALKGYKKELPSSADMRNFYATIDGGGSVESAAFPQQQGSPSSGQSVRDQTAGQYPSIQHASSIIRRQVTYEKAKNQSIGDLNVSSIIKNGDYESRRIDVQARGEIEKLWSPQAHPTDPRMLDRTYLESREKQIISAAKDEQEHIRRVALSRANQYRKTAEMRQTSLDQVADNLEEQMRGKPSNGGVRLLAEGTDLYVRRYGSTTGNHAISEVHGAVARIYGKRAESNSGAVNNDIEARDGQANVRSRSVRGKVLN